MFVYADRFDLDSASCCYLLRHCLFCAVYSIHIIHTQTQLLRWHRTGWRSWEWESERMRMRTPSSWCWDNSFVMRGIWRDQCSGGSVGLWPAWLSAYARMECVGLGRVQASHLHRSLWAPSSCSFSLPIPLCPTARCHTEILAVFIAVQFYLRRTFPSLDFHWLFEYWNAGHVSSSAVLLGKENHKWELNISIVSHWQRWGEKLASQIVLLWKKKKF